MGTEAGTNGISCHSVHRLVVVSPAFTASIGRIEGKASVPPLNTGCTFDLVHTGQQLDGQTRTLSRAGFPF
jgi:hypothetical protein